MRKKLIVIFVMLIAIVGTFSSSPRERMVEVNDQMTSEKERKKELLEKYKDLKIIDVHNHDAAEQKYRRSINDWNKHSIDQVVLFGNVSEPAAVYTDAYSWDAYEKYPDAVIPFFSGFNMHSSEGVDTVKEKLELGYMGVGEVVASSTRSPIVSNVKWKGLHPLDGLLPDIYALCSQYKAPILLHVDPLIGEPIIKLKEALFKFPDTTFILAHGNVGLSPASMKFMLNDYSNLYIDFYAGFTAYDSLSKYKLEDYIPVIEQFPSQFLFGTDSGYGINYEQAVLAVYETIDLLSRPTAEMVAYKNMNGLLEAQPSTTTQKNKLKQLSLELESPLDINDLNKREANEWIIKLEK